VDPIIGPVDGDERLAEIAQGGFPGPADVPFGDEDPHRLPILQPAQGMDAEGVAVGARREAAVILTVDAAAMHAAGHAFRQGANGVWLTDHVPPGYLSGWPG